MQYDLFYRHTGRKIGFCFYAYTSLSSIKATIKNFYEVSENFEFQIRYNNEIILNNITNTDYIKQLRELELIEALEK